MTIRKATKNDIQSIADIYTEVQTACENGTMTTGWKRGVYPTAETAEAALARDDLFALEDGGKTVGTAIINQCQDDAYAGANWQYPAPREKVMVLHTLAISPSASGKGYGRKFVEFYEEYALAHGCPYLRMDTRESNVIARAVYKKFGYSEIGFVTCNFNGIEGVRLVLLEKHLDN
ncbi:MAG: GNAT family N-acetyltransferase [Clostridia bacterium]|nr:GNAT family N-acetyltransferase [Clostridia bacterium]